MITYDKSRLQYTSHFTFKHYLIFFQYCQGVGAFPILRFSHMRRLFHQTWGLFLGGLRFPFVSPGLLIPAQLGRVAKTGCIFVIADGALGRIWVWMVCCICLASNPALVAYEIVLSGSAYCRLHSSFSRSCFFFFVFFSSIFFYIRCCSRAIST